MRQDVIISVLKRVIKIWSIKGIAHVELICNSRMIIHIVPEEKDYDRVLEGLNNPVVYPSLGRYEDCWIYSRSGKLR